MKTYQSKKDPNVTAKIEKEDEKYGTVLMVYTAGPDEGKTFSITGSTLKRWWKAVDAADETPSVMDTIDYEQVNTSYPEPKEQKYIPKPQSVVEYEAKKARKFNAELPTQDDMVERFGKILSKVNKTYIVFQNQCWLERKSGYTNLYATEEVWEQLTMKGLQARANGMKNTKLKFVFKIETLEQYETVAEVLENV